MRIVAGERGGIRLTAPRGRATRPTSDLVRGAAFSMLGDVTGLAVLDAFAGSGALGLEALSRGAGRGVFWETSGPALRALRENVERLGYEDRCSVQRRDARRGLAAAASAGHAFGLILLDPPYTMLPALQAPFSLHLAQLLVPGGRALVESRAASAPLALPLALEADRVHGDTRIAIYRHA